MKRRVAVTGLGMLCPLGTGVEKAWNNAIAGKSGIGEITFFDASRYKTRIAGQVRDFNAEDFVNKKDAKRFERFISFAIAAGKMALEDAKLELAGRDAERCGVITGCGLGGLKFMETTMNDIVRAYPDPAKVSPFFIPMIIGNMAAGMISVYFNAKGPNLSIATACAAGTHAIGEAFKAIQDGRADLMVTGGTEAVITPTCILGFGAMKALSTANDDPTKASRPFDRDRNGFVVGEGAGMLILEEMDHALARGAKIYAEMVGMGMSGDAFHMTAPCDDGEGAARCMQAALDDAGIKPQNVAYINAHGTSTALNDLMETKAVKTVFGEHAYKLAMSSTKSMTGHLLGGGGGVEAVFTVKAIAESIAPPTINYDNPDPECDLDYVPNVARKMDIPYAMSNSFGFGGTNGTVVFKKYQD